MNLQHIADSLRHLWPELWLTAALVLLLALDLVFQHRGRRFLLGVAAITLIINVLLVALRPAHEGLLLGMVQLGPLASAFQYVFNVAALLSLGLWASLPLPTHDEGQGEYITMLITMLLGAHLLAMAQHLLLLYLALEMVSIAGYALAVFGFTRRSTEAGMKYVLFGVFASATMLYGMSWLYGLAGGLGWPALAQALANSNNAAAWVAVLLTSAGFLFKIAASPLHTWTPDVYEGAPAPVVALLATLPKAAGFAALLGFSQVAEGVAAYMPMLALVALLSILLGNLSALWQSAAKRLMAYSSIAHAGFVLVGVVARSPEAVFYYLAVYTLVQFAVFALIAQAEAQLGSDAIADFGGLGKTAPLMAFALLVGMAALIGLPPTGGFMAKLLVFSALWQQWQHTGHWWLGSLLGLGLAATVVSVYFYLKIPYVMFFRPAPRHIALKPESFGASALPLALALLVLLALLKADWVLSLLKA